MKRFYLSRVYEDEIEGWVPALYRYRDGELGEKLVYGAWTDLSRGLQFGQVAFAASVLPGMQSDADMILMDDWPLGVTWASVPTARRNQVRDQVNAMGLSFQHQTGMTVRQVLDLIATQIQAGRTCEELNVRDIWG